MTRLGHATAPPEKQCCRIERPKQAKNTNRQSKHLAKLIPSPALQIPVLEKLMNMQPQGQLHEEAENNDAPNKRHHVNKLAVPAAKANKRDDVKWSAD